MNGVYPTTAQGLWALLTRPDIDPKRTRWNQLLRELRNDPWQNNYMYICAGSKHPESYDLYSASL